MTEAEGWPPVCCERANWIEEENVRAGVDPQPDDWDPCEGCPSGQWLREHKLAPGLSFVWNTYHLAVAGPASRDLGAGPVMWELLLKRIGEERFLRVVEATNIIDTERTHAINENHRAEILNRDTTPAEPGKVVRFKGR